MSEQEITNRVTQSNLTVLDLESLYPHVKISQLDLAEVLENGLILREKLFREWVKNHTWADYKNQTVAVFCSADAIIPAWAFMLIAVSLKPHAHRIFVGPPSSLTETLFLENIRKMDWQQYKDARVVVKGCSSVEVPMSIYTEVAAQLQPLAISVFYGEPCSTVPVYKKPRE